VKPRKPIKRPPWFDKLWALVPKAHLPLSRRECREIWVRKKLEPQGEIVVGAYKEQLSWPCFANERIMYLKRLPSWLRKDRWEDERPPDKAKGSDWTPHSMRSK